MNWLLTAYIFVYASFSVAGIWLDVKDKYAWWLVLVDCFASLFGTVGMVLYLLNSHGPTLDLVFRFGFPVFILCSLFIAVIDVFDQWKESEEDRGTVIASSLVGLLVEIPSYVICYLYAFA